MASTFKPIVGIAQEWITSADVTNNRAVVFTGKYVISLVFSNRNIFELSMKFSVSVELIEVYS